MKGKCYACETKALKPLISIKPEVNYLYCAFCSHIQKDSKIPVIMRKAPTSILDISKFINDNRFDFIDADTPHYFTLKSYAIMLKRSGFDIQSITRSGDYLDIVAKEGNSLDFKLKELKDLLEVESESKVGSYSKIKEAADFYLHNLNMTFKYLEESHKRVVVYGVSAWIVNMISHAKDLGHRVNIQYAVDEDPDIQYKEHNGLNLRVESPGALRSEAYLMILSSDPVEDLYSKFTVSGGSFEIVHYYPHFGTVVPR